MPAHSMDDQIIIQSMLPEHYSHDAAKLLSLTISAKQKSMLSNADLMDELTGIMRSIGN